jgi:hypothetical protein
MNKPSFEQLIEYVINDEEAKARELFHQIVVEKSRTIYESLMDEDEQIDEDDAMGRTDRYDESMGGDQADDLIDDVEAEEQGMQEAEDEEMEVDDEMEVEIGDEDDHHADVGGNEELEDRVVDLEDKLDELMAEFEAMMGGDEMGSEMGDEMDSPNMTDMEVVDDEMETEGMGMGMAPIPMEEAVSLKAVPAPKHGDNGANNKSPVAANSGAKGMAASPVKMTGDVAQGRPAPTAKDVIGKVGNTPAQGTQEPKPATKPHLAQATGVNTKSPLPKQ